VTRRRNTLALFLLLLSTSPAQAHLWLEPTAGYTTGLIGQSNVPALRTSTFLLGARLGYKISAFTFGAEYSMGLFGTTTQFGHRGDYKPIDVGGFLIYDLFWNLKAYAGVFFISKAKIAPAENAAEFSGTSFRAGLGWAGLSFCSLNFESTFRLYTAYGGTGLAKAIRGFTFGGSISFPLFSPGEKYGPYVP
jgi:hypothetical protein